MARARRVTDNRLLLLSFRVAGGGDVQRLPLPIQDDQVTVILPSRDACRAERALAAASASAVMLLASACAGGLSPAAALKSS